MRVAAGPRAGRVLALAALAAASAAVWWPVLGAGLLWGLPVVVLGLSVAAGVLRPRAAGPLLLLWLPVAPLLAGVPADALRPGELGSSAGALLTGLDALSVPSRGPVAGDPWPLAGALLAAGLAWPAAGLLAARRGTLPATLALALTGLPIVAALGLEQTGDAAWPGAVVLVAGLLWAARGRLAALVPAGVAVAVVAAAGAQALGPDEGWLPFVDVADRKPAFSRLDPTQTYGPLPDRRTGRTMLEITSPEPALWRMQVLERYDGRGWGVLLGRGPDLPQPAASTTTSTVRVRGLANRLVVAPGRVVEVRGGVTLGDAGEARQLRSSPRAGLLYRVDAAVVRVAADQLDGIPVPTGPEYDAYVELFPGQRYGLGGRRGSPAAQFAHRLGPRAATSRFGRVLALAQRLSAGTSSQLEVVRRVVAHLVGGDRYRYTLDVPEPGRRPLIDFLLEDREGYCQQFAGAAALLLRLAGVPTRVVTGFATGTPKDDDDTYVVRDQDAHAWIEVYFPGVGWVPFNPTPADAEAAVAEELDVLAPDGAARAGAGGAGGELLAVPALGLLAGAAVLARRRRRARPPTGPMLGDVLAGLVPGSTGPATTLSALRPALERVGPATAALAVQAERARFADAGSAPERHPRLCVWRALRRDVGTARATAGIVRTVRRRGA